MKPVSLLLVAMLLLAGCGSPPEENGGASPKPETPPTRTDSATTTPNPPSKNILVGCHKSWNIWRVPNESMTVVLPQGVQHSSSSTIEGTLTLMLCDEATLNGSVMRPLQAAWLEVFINKPGNGIGSIARYTYLLEVYSNSDEFVTLAGAHGLTVKKSGPLSIGTSDFPPEKTRFDFSVPSATPEYSVRGVRDKGTSDFKENSARFFGAAGALAALEFHLEGRQIVSSGAATIDAHPGGYWARNSAIPSVPATSNTEGPFGGTLDFTKLS